MYFSFGVKNFRELKPERINSPGSFYYTVIISFSFAASKSSTFLINLS